MSEKQMQGDVDPRRVFYITLSVDFCDGSAGVSWDGSQGFQDQEKAIEHAKQEADEHGATSVIVQCIPIKIVKRGPVQVTTIKVKP